jgi:hypothetical protein
MEQLRPERVNLSGEKLEPKALGCPGSRFANRNGIRRAKMAAIRVKAA